MHSKTCIACGDSKPRDAYYKHPRTADGLLGRCKDCHKAAMRAVRSANLERYRALDRARAHDPERVEARKAYAQTPGGAEALRRASRAWDSRNRHKKAAHAKLNYAVATGSVQRQPCEKCGSPHTEGHHDDYDKPLDVRWLCTAHHAQAHVELRNQNRDPDAWKPMKGRRARVQHDPIAQDDRRNQ